jgi:hypothetical protein
MAHDSFNDVSSSYCVMLNGRMVVNNELEGMWKWPWLSMGTCTISFLLGLKKTTRNLSLVCFLARIHSEHLLNMIENHCSLSHLAADVSDYPVFL